MLTLLVGVLAAGAPAAETPAPRALPFSVQTSRLPNGLTVSRVPHPSPGLVAYFTVLRVGSRNEVEPNHTGFAHFFEHMMFKGTATHPEGVREEFIAQNGFDDNAFTTQDVTVYHSYGPSAALEQLITLEADRFRNLEYAEPVFQTEANAVLGEYHKSAARPDLRLRETVLSTAFTRHTYRHTTLGYYADIQRMPGYFEYSKRFFERWYRPENTLLFVVGDFDDAKLMGWIEQHYGPWRPGATKLQPRAEPAQRTRRKAEVKWDGPTLPKHVVAWHTPASRLDTLDAAIQALLVEYLVGATSPLHKELVLERQLVEGIGTWFSEHRDPFLFSIVATLREEGHRAAVLQAVERELAALRGGKIDPARLDAIQRNARYGALMNLESPKDVGFAVAVAAGIYGDPEAAEKALANLQRVTAEHLVAFARRHLVDPNRTDVTLTRAAALAQPKKEARR
jgi:zinc protease